MINMDEGNMKIKIIDTMAWFFVGVVLLFSLVIVNFMKIFAFFQKDVEKEERLNKLKRKGMCPRI